MATSTRNGSEWGSCVLSALVGSALTLLVLELRHRSKHSVPSSTLADEKPDDTDVNSTTFRDALPVTTNGHSEDQEWVNIESDIRPNIGCRRQSTRLTSVSGSFRDVDGVNRHSVGSLASSNSVAEWPEEERNFAPNGTNIHVLSEESGLVEDKDIREHAEFDAKVVSKLKSLEESKLLLHRTRAVSALASRLMAAPDEEACYEVVSRLLVPLFHVDRCSYALKTDADHIILKSVAVKQRKHVTVMGLDGAKKGGVILPLKDTMVGLCATTLQQQYCPRTSESTFETQRSLHTIGLNSILATPILVNGSKFAGAIVVSMEKEDAFRKYDRILIQDIASMLGANIYAKRMRKAAEHSNKISREMLHSMIPPKVIQKIEVFWDENSNEYMSRRSSNSESLRRNSFVDSATDLNNDESVSQNVMSRELTRRRRPATQLNRCESVDQKLNFLNTMNNLGDDDSDNATGVIVDAMRMEINTVASALYAENVKDVVVIFSDIVGFSKMALSMKPLEVMDMLQSLFSRFDTLCDKHGITKLETIGDAYICTANLFDEEQFGGNAADAACAALEMAKDMVLATQDETLEIRVGIHIGEVTCGVLGERLPKFTVFGHHVNLAARMEQTCKPNMIRVSEEFWRLVANVEDGWDEYEVVTMKNMGDVGTYILDPLERYY
ncbi:hypothetical protein HJC23_009515 [Cyclotella cryptica]|uniref:Guanylate cyclase domain-containing protein n=1 Tax=Cyclotella cryptica TaxID=29204 RepID=A0ABD3Q4S9_9STRA|eukprot:CCRYP_008837-RA/>CCRYP_008837-RA protein AED:0.02 eAED:0.02 QI:118/1/1/1/1/1/2/249/667